MFGRPVPVLLATLLATGASVAAAWTTAEQPTVELSVKLTSGRTYTGSLAPETDFQALHLAKHFRAGRITRRIEWPQIAEVTIAGRSYSGTQVLQVWTVLQRDATPTIAHRPGRSFGVTGPKPDRSAAQQPTVDRDPVTCLNIEARVGRWNSGVEGSGLVLQIMPVDASGRLTPIDGTLLVELVSAPLTPLEKSPSSRIGYWQIAVRSGDFQWRGAEYRLSFQAVHPEFAYVPLEHGLIHARLSVPGQGTFEASQDAISLRPHFTPVRDFLESHQPGSAPRFLPDERTGRR